MPRESFELVSLSFISFSERLRVGDGVALLKVDVGVYDLRGGGGGVPTDL